LQNALFIEPDSSTFIKGYLLDIRFLPIWSIALVSTTTCPEIFKKPSQSRVKKLFTKHGISQNEP